MERAREERRVTEVVSHLAETPDDPTRRPNLDDCQARAIELTPADASPEERAQVNRMIRIEHAQADRAMRRSFERRRVLLSSYFDRELLVVNLLDRSNRNLKEDNHV